MAQQIWRKNSKQMFSPIKIVNNTLPKAVLVDDLTLPEGFPCQSGEIKKKVWRIRNAGQQPWPQNTVLQYSNGPIVPAVEGATGALEPVGSDSLLHWSMPIQSLGPGEFGNITLQVLVPSQLGYASTEFVVCFPRQKASKAIEELNEDDATEEEHVRPGLSLWIGVNVTKNKANTVANKQTPVKPSRKTKRKAPMSPDEQRAASDFTMNSLATSMQAAAISAQTPDKRRSGSMEEGEIIPSDEDEDYQDDDEEDEGDEDYDEGDEGGGKGYDDYHDGNYYESYGHYEEEYDDEDDGEGDEDYDDEETDQSQRAPSTTTSEAPVPVHQSPPHAQPGAVKRSPEQKRSPGDRKQEEKEAKERRRQHQAAQREREKALIKNAQKNKTEPIDPSSIKYGNKIGSGSFGTVFKGTLWGQEVALKVLEADTKSKKDKEPKNTEDAKADELERIENFYYEVEIMQRLRHPNIVSFLGACYDGRLCIVTECLHGGSLGELLEKNLKAGQRLSMKKILNFAGQIARGLNWLHHKGIIHRDLKTDNILLDKHNNLKIADFGLSHVKLSTRANDTGFYGACGTACYMAPEVITKSSYGVAADVFSFGVILCEMISGIYPFDDTSARKYNTVKFDDAIVAGLRPSIPGQCPPALSELMQLCWKTNPTERPSMDSIVARLVEIGEQLEAQSHDITEDLPAEALKMVQEQQRRMAEQDREIAELTRKNKKLDSDLAAAKDSEQQLSEHAKKVQAKLTKRRAKFDLLKAESETQIQHLQAQLRRLQPSASNSTPSADSSSNAVENISMLMGDLSLNPSSLESLRSPSKAMGPPAPIVKQPHNKHPRKKRLSPQITVHSSPPQDRLRSSSSSSRGSSKTSVGSNSVQSPPFSRKGIISPPAAHHARVTTQKEGKENPSRTVAMQSPTRPVATKGVLRFSPTATANAKARGALQQLNGTPGKPKAAAEPGRGTRSGTGTRKPPVPRQGGESKQY